MDARHAHLDKLLDPNSGGHADPGPGAGLVISYYRIKKERPGSHGARNCANMVAIVSRSPGFAVTLNSKASPGQMSPGLRAPTGVSVEPTWTMPGWPFRDSASGPVGPSSARASSPLPRSGSSDVNSGARFVGTHRDHRPCHGRAALDEFSTNACVPLSCVPL